MVARSAPGAGSFPRLAGVAIAVLAVVPLLAPLPWSGARLAASDLVLAVVSQFEAALSIRTPAGIWSALLLAIWFGLAYRQRHVRPWEAVAVLLGGLVAVVRVGNVWLLALLLLGPLGRRTADLPWRWWSSALAATTCVAAAALVTLSAMPPRLTAAAGQAARSAGGAGAVYADWRWAPHLRQELGGHRAVLFADGPSAEPTEAWVDYLRVAQGHERWAAILDEWRIGLVVLDARDQQRKAAALVRASPSWRVLVDDGSALVAERR